MKRILIIVPIILVVLVAGLWYINRSKTPAVPQGWSLSEEGAIYVIHGARDYDTGPGYYLYKIHKGETSVARIDPTSTADITHFTDRPVKIAGSVKSDASGATIIFLTNVERAE